MRVDILHDFARSVARLAEMVDLGSPARSKVDSDVEAVEFLAQYFTWEHIHFDGTAHTMVLGSGSFADNQ
jgi:hypothetical protein